MADPSVRLPDGRFFGLTWTIPGDFGGLTSVLLHRSAMFAARGIPIDVLTLAPDLDLSVTEARLRASGRLAEGVRVRNLWAELGEASDAELARVAGPARRWRHLIARAPERTGELRRERRGTGGELLQVDHFRPGGSILATDRRDIARRGVLGGRAIALFGRAGRPLGLWRSASAFYGAWFDHVIGEEPAFLINDSQLIGGFLNRYRRDHVVTVHVVHNAHLVPDAADAFGRFVPQKLDMVKALHGVDLVVALTERQASELREAELVHDNVRVVPNSRPARAAPDLERPRNPRHGVMLARLVHQKRVDHTVRAIAAAREAGAEVTLDIYGDGKKRPELNALIERLGLQDAVSLKGFDPQAAEHFETASFTVLSSRFEGMTLSLIEAMASGCLPVAYDIRYGVRELVDDRENGFLVPPEKIQALGRAIADAAALGSAELRRMRESAVRRAGEFEDAAVLGVWARELRAARDRKLPVRSIRALAWVGRIEVSAEEVRLIGRVAGAPATARGWVSWHARRLAAYGRSQVAFGPHGTVVRSFEAVIPRARWEGLAGERLTLCLDLLAPGGVARVHLRAGALQGAGGEDGIDVLSSWDRRISLRVSG